MLMTGLPAGMPAVHANATMWSLPVILLAVVSAIVGMPAILISRHRQEE